MGTPVRNDYVIDYSKFESSAIIRNIYDTSDLVQRGGGYDNEGKFFASQKIYDSKVKNINVESPNNGIILYPTSILNIKEQLNDDHSNLDSKKVWEQFNER